MLLPTRYQRIVAAHNRELARLRGDFERARDRERAARHDFCTLERSAGNGPAGAVWNLPARIKAGERWRDAEAAKREAWHRYVQVLSSAEPIYSLPIR